MLFTDLFATHSPILDVSFSIAKVAESTEVACADHRLVILSIRPTRNGLTGDPLAIALLDALRHRPHPTTDMREGAHAQLTVNVPPPSLTPNEGGHRPVGAVAITVILTANLITDREVLGEVKAPLATAALSAPLVTFALFLTVHPHTTAAIHTPNRTLLLRTLLYLHNQKWAIIQFAVPSPLPKTRLWPRQRPYRWPPRRQYPLILPKCPRGRSQMFSRRLLH